MHTSTPISHSHDNNANNNRRGKRPEEAVPQSPQGAEQLRTFKFPDCWQDDQRMGILLAPFRLRSVNVEHYDTKMKFWQDLIGQYCDHKGDARFNKRELKLAFVRGEWLPACLDTVLEDMLRTKCIRSRVEYEYDPMNSWTGWAVNSFVRKPISWSFMKLKHTVGLVDMEKESNIMDYIHLAVIKNFCKKLQTQVLQPQQGKLLHYDTLKALLNAAALNLNEDCFKLCLHTLHCQHKIGLEYKTEDGERHLHLIKIPGKANANDVQITEADRAVHNLQMTQRNLLQQLETLEEDIKENEAKARDYLKANKRQLAKTYLRKKHLLEKNHEKRSVALHNIETLLSNVDEAQNNGEILDAYKIGSKALQKALDASGLKYDNVDEVIAEVRDTMETHNELQDTLGNTILTDAASNYENDELERELQQIMGETATKDKPPQDKTITKTPTTSKGRVENYTNTNNNNNNTPVRTVTITDAELLAMLDDLEVEDDSISLPSTPVSTQRKMDTAN